MGHRRRHIAVLIGSGRWLAATLALLAVMVSALATTAQANTGYELDASNPSRSVTGVPHGIAVDQANQRIYLAITTSNPGAGSPGEIDRFESNLTAAGTFTSGGSPYYTGVAVNPLTQGFYAAQALLHTPIGKIGTAQMDVFSSSGVAATPFALSDTETLPQIAVDSAGDVYYPDAATHSVRVFNSAGVLQENITCGGCSGGSLSKPVSVAMNSQDDLYVVDLAQDKVIKLTSSGGSYSYASTLQSGRGAAAVGVDPSTDDVFVGDLPEGRNYHIVAYNSSGVQFDDFGAGLFTNPEPPFGALFAQQIAADETTHRLYVGDVGKFYIFDRVTISPPAATVKPATPVGQLTATLRGLVNANGHAVLSCKFEYTDDSDFLSNGFAHATAAPCSEAPVGSKDEPILAKVSGLSPVTTYHYRVMAASNAGLVNSGGETFETMPVVSPTVVTEPATAITQTDAKLTGSVNPHGGSVSNCHFEYGTSVSYGTSISCTALPEPVATDVSVTRKILKLTPSTTYHYKLVVTSNAGTEEGEDVEFTSASPPPPEVVVPPVTTPPLTTTVPPPVVTPTPPHVLRCRKGFRKKKVRGKLRCVKKHKHAKHPTTRKP